jgi:hypothetical protein
MLREIPKVRQIAGAGRRRWFADNYFDLIVWYEGNAIAGFQLCYDPNGAPRAYTWTKNRGGRHYGIDAGDDRRLVKAAPVLVSDGAFDVAAVQPRFLAAARKLPLEIRRLVLAQMAREEKRTANPNVAPNSKLVPRLSGMGVLRMSRTDFLPEAGLPKA